MSDALEVPVGVAARAGGGDVRARLCSSSIDWSSSPTKAVPRSKLNVVIVTRQPAFSSPTRLATGTRTSSRKSSANSSEPAMVRSGRSSMPGELMGRMSHEMPR